MRPSRACSERKSEASPVKDFLAGSSGQALDGPMRSNMEGALGADLSDVRVHRGGSASSSAASVQARAYTVGSDVVLGNDVNPASGEGQKTLAHELTHVVQQRQGPVDGTPAAGGIRLSDPGDRFERAAEATAASVMSGGSAAPTSAGGAGGATAQREAAGGGAGAAPASGEESRKKCRAPSSSERPRPARKRPRKTRRSRPDAARSPRPRRASEVDGPGPREDPLGGGRGSGQLWSRASRLRRAE